MNCTNVMTKEWDGKTKNTAWNGIGSLVTGVLFFFLSHT